MIMLKTTHESILKLKEEKGLTIISITHKIASLRQEIEQGGDVPNSVRNILKSKL